MDPLQQSHDQTVIGNNLQSTEKAIKNSARFTAIAGVGYAIFDKLSDGADANILFTAAIIGGIAYVGTEFNARSLRRRQQALQQLAPKHHR